METAEKVTAELTPAELELINISRQKKVLEEQETKAREVADQERVIAYKRTILAKKKEYFDKAALVNQQSYQLLLAELKSPKAAMKDVVDAGYGAKLVLTDRKYTEEITKWQGEERTVVWQESIDWVEHRIYLTYEDRVLDPAFTIWPEKIEFSGIYLDRGSNIKSFQTAWLKMAEYVWSRMKEQNKKAQSDLALVLTDHLLRNRFGKENVEYEKKTSSYRISTTKFNCYDTHYFTVKLNRFTAVMTWSCYFDGSKATSRLYLKQVNFSMPEIPDQPMSDDQFHLLEQLRDISFDIK